MLFQKRNTHRRIRPKPFSRGWNDPCCKFSSSDFVSQGEPMERICKTCKAPFDPTFARQLNCGECKQKKTVYKQNEREERGLGKIPDAFDYVMPERQETHDGRFAGCGTNRRDPARSRERLDQEGYARKEPYGADADRRTFRRCSRGDIGRACTPQPNASSFGNVPSDVPEVSSDGRRVVEEEPTVCQFRPDD